MRRILYLALILSARFANAQSNVVPICDQQTTSHCWYLAGASTLTTDRVLTLGDGLITSPANILVQSGSSSVYPYVGLGRTAPDAYLGVVAVANNFTTGTLPGDLAVLTENSANAVMLGSGSSGGAVMWVIGGDVGIGTRSPAAQLDLTGDAIIRGSSPAINAVNGYIEAQGFLSAVSGGSWQGVTSTTDGALLRGYGVAQNAGGTAGGYFDFAPITYPPSGSTDCYDAFGNHANQPKPLNGLSSFGANDLIWWNSLSPMQGYLYPYTNPLVPPYPNSYATCATTVTANVIYGTNTNGYIWAMGGFASGLDAFNTVHLFNGGVTAQSLLAGGFYPQGTVTHSYGTLSAPTFIGGYTATGVAKNPPVNGCYSIASCDNPLTANMSLEAGIMYWDSTLGYENLYNGTSWGPISGPCSWPTCAMYVASPTTESTIAFQSQYYNGSTSAYNFQVDYFGNVSMAGALAFAQEAAPSVSASGRSTIYMDSTTHALEVSQNGSAYVPLVTAGSGCTSPTCTMYEEYPSSQGTIAFQTQYYNGSSSAYNFQVDYFGNISNGGGIHTTGTNTSLTYWDAPIGSGLTIAPAANSLAAGFYVSQSAHGTGPWDANVIAIASDDTTNPSGGFNHALEIYHALGGTAMTGGRNSLEVDTFFNAPSSYFNVNRNYVAVVGAATANSGDNGTGVTLATARGAVFGGNFVATSASGATDLLGVVGAEVNWNVNSGVNSVAISAGISLVPGGSYHGNLVDTYIDIGALSGSAIPNYIIEIDNEHGGVPIGSSTTLVGTSASAAGDTIGSGIDLSGLTIANFFLKSPGFYVDGSGNVEGKAFQSTVTGSTIAFQANGGTFQVDGTGNISGGGVANLTGGYKANGVQIISGAGALTPQACTGCAPAAYASPGLGGAINTVYRNTSSYGRMVQVVVTLNSSGNEAACLIGPTSSPATVVYAVQGPASSYQTIHCPVPPGYYYDVLGYGASQPTVGAWYEFY